MRLRTEFDIINDFSYDGKQPIFVIQTQHKVELILSIMTVRKATFSDGTRSAVVLGLYAGFDGLQG